MNFIKKIMNSNQRLARFLICFLIGFCPLDVVSSSGAKDNPLVFEWKKEKIPLKTRCQAFFDEYGNQDFDTLALPEFSNKVGKASSHEFEAAFKDVEPYAIALSGYRIFLQLLFHHDPTNTIAQPRMAPFNIALLENGDFVDFNRTLPVNTLMNKVTFLKENGENAREQFTKAFEEYKNRNHKVIVNQFENALKKVNAIVTNFCKLDEKVPNRIINKLVREAPDDEEALCEEIQHLGNIAIQFEQAYKTAKKYDSELQKLNTAIEKAQEAKTEFDAIKAEADAKNPINADGLVEPQPLDFSAKVSLEMVQNSTKDYMSYEKQYKELVRKLATWKPESDDKDDDDNSDGDVGGADKHGDVSNPLKDLEAAQASQDLEAVLKAATELNALSEEI